MTRTRRNLRALLAALALLAATVGLPVLLHAVAGSPIPTSLPTWDQISDAILSPDDGTLLLGVLKYVAWTCWAFFTASVLLDLAARMRGVSPPSWGPQQALASRLIAVVLAAGITAPTLTAAGPATAQAATTGTSPSAAPTAVAHVIPAAVPGPDTPDGHRTVVVEVGDTFWDIADDELGDPHRWPEMYEASRDTVQPDGETITDPDLIHPGETITLPVTAVHTTPAPQTPQPPPAQATIEEEPAAAVPSDDTITTPRGHDTAPATPDDTMAAPSRGGGGFSAAAAAAAAQPAAIATPRSTPPADTVDDRPVILTPLTGGNDSAQDPQLAWQQHIAADAAGREQDWRERISTPRSGE